MSRVKVKCNDCEYESESEYGQHCIKCIHNASEQFRPKAKYVERARIATEMARLICKTAEAKAVLIDLGGESIEVISIDSLKELVINVEDYIKGGQ